MRGPLLPPTVPGWRSRAERFDMAVLEAYEPIERRWQDRVSGLDVAVDEIPRISPKDPEAVQWPPEVVADGPIALARGTYRVWGQREYSPEAIRRVLD